MNDLISLDQLRVGESGFVCVSHADASSPFAHRLRELGLREGTRVQCVGVSPLGDPVAYRICDTILALRRQDCADILLRRFCD